MTYSTHDNNTQNSSFNHDNNINNLPFPIKNILNSAKKETQASPEISLGVLLTMLSSTFQGRMRVVSPHDVHKTIGVNLYTIILANSGSRKSTVENIFFKNNVNQLETIIQMNRINNTQYDIDHKVWKNILTMINKTSSSNPDFKSQLTDHFAQEPKINIYCKNIVSDISLASLIKELTLEEPYSLLKSSDAISLLEMFLSSQNTTFFNTLWDNEIFTQDRVNQKGIYLNNTVRLSVLLMTQPDIFLNHKKLTQAKQSGLMARCLIFSSPGHITDASFTYNENATALAIDNLIAPLQLDSDEIVMTWSKNASLDWIKYHTQCKELLPNNIGAEDFLHKFMNNASRLAALLHFAAYQNTEISSESLDIATDICSICLSNYQKIFKQSTLEEQAENCGNLLWEWLCKNSRNDYNITEIYQYGPSAIRSKEKVNIAIGHLEGKKLISVHRNARPAYLKIKSL